MTDQVLEITDKKGALVFSSDPFLPTFMALAIVQRSFAELGIMTVEEIGTMKLRDAEDEDYSEEVDTEGDWE